MTTPPTAKRNASRRWTRREFLKTAAAFAAPAIVPASVLGAEAPSERVNVGIIGLGKLGSQSHLAGLLNTSGVQVVALCDVERIRLNDAQKRVDATYAQRFGKAAYKGCTTHVDFRELLARAEVDAVVIVSPEYWHAIHAVQACRAGKHVYCEKPMAYTLGEARAVVNAAERYGRVFQVGSQQRSDYTFRYACELVRNGRIGDVHTVHVNCGGPPRECRLPAEPTPPSMEWDLWLGPAPWRPYNTKIQPISLEPWCPWKIYRDYGGSGMTDMGAHHFDIAQWGLGMDHSGPVEVHPRDGGQYERLTYKYANGVALTHGGAMAGSAVEFIGTEGRVAVNRGHFLKTEPENLATSAIGPGEVHLYESRSHRGNWLDCIRTGRETVCPAEVGCRSVCVCHLGFLGYRL